MSPPAGPDPEISRRLDPALRDFAAARSDLSLETLAAVRQSLDERRAAALATIDSTGVDITDPIVPRDTGPPIPVRVYRGAAAPSPGVIYCHAGAFVLGNLDTDHRQCVELARRGGCTIISVDYRLAPEHPFPAAVDDVLAVARWVTASIGSLGGDPARIAIAGDSAGGNLAAVTANELPGTFALQVLIYPATDLNLTHPSVQENGQGYLLTKEAMDWFADHYLGDTDRRLPQVSPLFADDATLAAAPSALIITGEFDPLRDEGEAYAERLRAAGVTVEHRRYDGMIHAFFPMRGMIPAAEQALEEVTAALARAWS